jgi:hypothetical protein
LSKPSIANEPFLPLLKRLGGHENGVPFYAALHSGQCDPEPILRLLNLQTKL